LIRQLVEYKKFKDAASQLQTLEVEQESVYPRIPGKIDFGQQIAGPKSEVSLFDLINAVNAVLKRVSKRDELRDIFEEKWTVAQKIEVLAQLVREKTVVKFSELFESATSRYEVVCTFLAVLELTRLKEIICTQTEAFGEIEIAKAVHSNAPAAEDTTDTAIQPVTASEPAATTPSTPATMPTMSPPLPPQPTPSTQPTPQSSGPTPPAPGNESTGA
jgi:segregation and condensation protein A